MSEGEPVQGLWTGTEEVTQSTSGIAAIHVALRVDRLSPPRQVVRSSQGVGSSPHCKCHHSSGYSVDGGLPADILPFLLQELQHLALEG